LLKPERFEIIFIDIEAIQIQMMKLLYMVYSPNQVKRGVVQVARYWKTKVMVILALRKKFKQQD
jgi:hypothetical protein